MNNLERAIEEINAWYKNTNYLEAYCPRIEVKSNVLKIFQDAFVDHEIVAIGRILKKTSVWYITGTEICECVIVASFPPEKEE